MSKNKETPTVPFCPVCHNLGLEERIDGKEWHCLTCGFTFIKGKP